MRNNYETIKLFQYRKIEIVVHECWLVKLVLAIDAEEHLKSRIKDRNNYETAN